MSARWVAADTWIEAEQARLERRELAARIRRRHAALAHQAAAAARQRQCPPRRLQPFRSREQVEAAARLVERVGPAEAARRLGVARSSLRLALRRHGLYPGRGDRGEPSPRHGPPMDRPEHP